MHDAHIPSTRHSRSALLLALGAALATLALSGCGASATTPSGQTSATAPAATTNSPTITSSTARSGPAPTRRPRRRSGGRRQGELVYSTASAQTAQPQPAPGTCHAIGSGLYSRPDPRCTPGALNPAVTQANVGQTICRQGWTDTVRPPDSISEPEKAKSMAAYGDAGPISAYEYDHLVPLELGGAVNDQRNLWPEPGASPNPKDAVEDELNQKVCDGQATLAQAQRAIATNWVALAGSPAASAPSTRSSAGRTTPTSVPPAAGAGCSVSGAYDDGYHDYSVYVHSNQPNATVTVTDASGRTATWHTDPSGYADVYFHAPADAMGETITARVGSAYCQATL
jgi:hypothetical protein